MLSGVVDHHRALGQEAAEIRVHIPVSIRGGADANKATNRFVPTRLTLPLTEMDRPAAYGLSMIQLIEAVQQGRRLHRTLVELLNRTTIPAANAHLRHVMAAVASAVAKAPALRRPDGPGRTD